MLPTAPHTRVRVEYISLVSPFLFIHQRWKTCIIASHISPSPHRQMHGTHGRTVVYYASRIHSGPVFMFSSCHGYLRATCDRVLSVNFLLHIFTFGMSGMAQCAQHEQSIAQNSVFFVRLVPASACTILLFFLPSLVIMYKVDKTEAM